MTLAVSLMLLLCLLALLCQLSPLPAGPWGKILLWAVLALLSVVLLLTGGLHLVLR